MNVFVDFDKTLTTGEGEPYWVEPLQEEPRDEMIDIVRELYKKGYTIIIYTSRKYSSREEVEYFLDEWEVWYHAVVMEKPGFDLLIDDRAISHEKALELGDEGIDSVLDSQA